jgi:RNA polymerase sigma-32 factor
MLTVEEEIELIKAWQERQHQPSLTRLIKAFEPLVLKFARRYASYGIDKDDLISVGNLALVETAKRFEPDKNFKFSTYSSHWINGMMLIYIASNYFSFTIKTQDMKKIFFKLRREIHNAQMKNEDENIDQIMDRMAEHFGCPKAELEKVYAMLRQPNLSLDEPIHRSGDGEEGTFGDTLFSDDPNPEETMIQVSKDRYHRELLESTMARVLNERERTIMRGQMLMDEDNERTLQDLADEFDLSRERVRQIRNNAYEKLEKAIRMRCSTRERRNMF